MKTVAIIANGALHDPASMSTLVNSHSYIIAVDGGLINCDAMNIVPHFIVGDMDSAPSELLEKYSQVPTRRYSPYKDKTDVELAIEHAIEIQAEKIFLFAVLERRLDHTLYNLNLLKRYSDKIIIESEYETIFCIEKSTSVPCKAGQTVSLLPLNSPACGVTTQGLEWELNNATLDHHFMSISNICLGSSFRVEVKEGSILCCLKGQKD